MRKLIGIIIELQSIFEKEKIISSDTFFKVCEDMGVSAQNAVKNILLSETATMYGVDLSAEFETYIKKKTIIELLHNSNKRKENPGINFFFFILFVNFKIKNCLDFHLK